MESMNSESTKTMYKNKWKYVLLHDYAILLNYTKAYQMSQDNYRFQISDLHKKHELNMW